MMLVLLVAVLRLVTGNAAHLDASVRGVLLDASSKPVVSAQVELWNRASESDEPTARGWRSRSDVVGVVKGRFDIGHVAPGSWVLAARFDRDASQDWIIHRFTLAEGETKDLGELKPEGKDHSFRLEILDPSGVDLTDQVAKSDGEKRSRLVRFDLVHRATSKDPPLSWSFFRSCGSLVTVRGLDMLGDGWELQPWIEEIHLLPEELRIHGNIRPIARIGAGRADPLLLDLFTSKARTVRVAFELPGKMMTPVSKPEDAGEVLASTYETGPADWPICVAVVDKVGNVRVFHMRFRESANVMSLPPGLYHIYALYTSNGDLESTDLFGAVNETVEIPDGDDVGLVRVRMNSGVTVTGTARVTCAFEDPRERRALSVGFTELPRQRALLWHDDSENMLIDVPIGNDGAFLIHNLPAGERFTIGLPGLPEAHSKMFVVPPSDGSVGEIVIE